MYKEIGQGREKKDGEKMMEDEGRVKRSKVSRREKRKEDTVGERRKERSGKCREIER